MIEIIFLNQKQKKLKEFFKNQEGKVDKKIEEIKRILCKLGMNLFEQKKYYDKDSDSINYKGLRYMRTLLEPEEDYY